MIVIVEGIDRVGKTTLCEKLQDRGFILLKDGMENFSDEKSATKARCSLAKLDTTFKFIEQIHNQGHNVVVDRLHLTEIVYGKCDRSRVVYDEEIADLEREFFERIGGNAVLVLVTPTNEQEAFERSGENQSKHVELFKSYFKTSNLRKIRTDFNTLDSAVARIVGMTDFNVEYDFYLASPFFRPDQVEREERIKALLRAAGYRVFSPKEACFLQSDAELSFQEAVFKDNCDAIKNSTAVFAITDTKDMGTIWEAGYAYGIKKPIIYFAETLGDNQFNLMLAQSGNLVLTSEKDFDVDTIDKVLDNPLTRIPYGGAIE